ncbi:MAG: M15 family metallopeptidase [Pseudomonadota bacterium]
MSIHTDPRLGTDLPVFDAETLNGELRPARAAINTALIGAPRGSYGAEAQPLQNAELERLLETEDLGPFQATGLKPAIAALRAIVTDISLELPDIYERLGADEMLACRRVRGSNAIISNHAWGIAIDLTIDGLRHALPGSPQFQALMDLWPIFNRHGFYWGIAFGPQDAFHFEASDQLVRRWAEEGAFGKIENVVLPRALNYGDRGPQVRHLQKALNTVLRPLSISEDGFFGGDTRMAVIALQRKAGLPPTGAAPKPVLSALGLEL